MKTNARSRTHMQKLGYRVWTVQNYNHHVRKYYDLFGFIDLLCVKTNEIVGVQAMGKYELKAHVSKMDDHEIVRDLISAGVVLEFHEWHQNKKTRRWTNRCYTLTHVTKTEYVFTREDR